MCYNNKDAGPDSEDVQLLSRYSLLVDQLFADVDGLVFSLSPADDELDEGKTLPLLSEEAKAFLKLFEALFRIRVDSSYSTWIDALNSFVIDQADAIATI